MPAPFHRLAARLGSGNTDGELLTRFVRDRDEPAFAALVHRHGPTVFGVCRRVLGNTADADDAFQAVFLVLVNRADALTSRNTLGDWLHGVAVRTAFKARTRFARLRKHERRAAETRSEPVHDHSPDEPSAWFDRELSALPDKFREPVVLCLIQERPRAEVAAELGIPEGTLASRLDTARKRLADRLGRYQVPLVFAGVLVSVPTALADATVNRVADGAGVAILQLANEVTQSMFTTTKWPVLIAAGVLTVAIGGLLLAAPGDRNARRNAPVPEKKEPPEPEWMKAFKKAYQLKDGEYVKRVTPPYIDERKEFLLERFRKQGSKDDNEGVRSWLAMGALFLEADGKAVTYKTMISTEADRDKPGIKTRKKRVKLTTLIDCCTGLSTPEVVYDERAEHQDVFMEDDFVLRKGASLEKLLPDLQKAIGECELDVFKAPPVFTMKEEEQEVYVVSGKFEIKPREWRDKDEIDVYADESVMDKGYSHRTPEPNHNLQSVWNYSTTVEGFARSLGSFLDKRMVWDAEFPPQTRFHYYTHAHWERKATAEQKAADHDPEKVLKNVSEQTGLTFKKEKRKVPVLYVSVPQ